MRSGWLALALPCLLAAAAVAPQAAAAADNLPAGDTAASAPLLADVPDDRIEAGLLTIAPGAVYWQRFGHNAIVLRDRAAPARVLAVNYGIFDFGERNFLLNFLRGRMYYFALAGDPRAEIADYAAAGRGVEVQWLDLAPAQVARLRARLSRDTSAAHSRYRYDYFTRNCSTRVRDALDFAVDGALARSSDTRSRGWTWRQQSLRLARPDLPLALGIHFGLAGYTDAPLSLWQEAFVPQRLADAVGDLEIGGVAVVARTEMLAPQRIALPSDSPPAWRWAFVLVGAALAIALWLLQRGSTALARKAFAIARGTILALCGIAGTGLLALWLGTDHIAAHRNLNLLVASPLCLLWLTAGFGRGRLARRMVALAIGGVLTSLVVAIWFALTSAARQDFADWLLLLAPVLLVLARTERVRNPQLPDASAAG